MSKSNLRIISWNVNSVRSRLDHIAAVIEAEAPDVICLQETKVINDAFPLRPFHALGYEHVALNGQKAHHGVATLSRVPFDDHHARDWCEMGDARHVCVNIRGVELHNFYVPAGGDEPDPAVNPKFDHKMRFLSEMQTWSEGLDTPAILVGDLNVAPLETDVWSHKALLRVVSHTPVEVAAMEAIVAANDWVDVMRDFVPADEHLYTWWSYRARDWRAANKGRRLDHVWTSPCLKGAAKGMRVLDDARGWERPSDHAPVMVDFVL